MTRGRGVPSQPQSAFCAVELWAPHPEEQGEAATEMQVRAPQSLVHLSGPGPLFPVMLAPPLSVGQLLRQPVSTGAEWWGRSVAAHSLGTGPARHLLLPGHPAESRLCPSCPPAPPVCRPHAAEHLAFLRVRVDHCMLMPRTQVPFLFLLLPKRGSP